MNKQKSPEVWKSCQQINYNKTLLATKWLKVGLKAWQTHRLDEQITKKPQKKQQTKPNQTKTPKTKAWPFFKKSFMCLGLLKTYFFLLRHCFVVRVQCKVLPVYYQCLQDMIWKEIKERGRPIKFPKNVFRYEISMKDLSWVFFQCMQPGPKCLRFSPLDSHYDNWLKTAFGNWIIN